MKRTLSKNKLEKSIVALVSNPRRCPEDNLSCSDIGRERKFSRHVAPETYGRVRPEHRRNRGNCTAEMGEANGAMRSSQAQFERSTHSRPQQRCSLSPSQDVP